MKKSLLSAIGLLAITIVWAIRTSSTVAVYPKNGDTLVGRVGNETSMTAMAKMMRVANRWGQVYRDLA
jgi:hypothetical protein